MARTMVDRKLSVHLPNCRGWAWVPPAIRSTHTGLAAARWPMHAAWGCRLQNYACAISTHIELLAKLLDYFLHSNKSNINQLEWHCNSFTDLIDEMELWDWNVANKDFWSRLAKSLHSQKVSVNGQKKKDQILASMLVPEKMSWATATRSIRKCKTRIEKIGGSRVDTEPTVWGLDVQVWNLLWSGEKAMKKGIPIFKR